jgi:MoaA/NifB/PqqE/SkfB family radical SAM enzyme
MRNLQPIENNFTATGMKLFHHPEAIEHLRLGRMHPIVLHIMPTDKCNLKCSFCSVANRGAGPDLKLAEIKSAVNDLRMLGMKAAILSGGGEPALYPEINELLQFLADNGLEIGLITNGTLFKRIDPEYLESLTWVRISANGLDQGVELDIPDIPVTLGFSYIWNEQTHPDTIFEIARLAKEHKAEYVRMLPDCNLPDLEFKDAQLFIGEYATRLGPPFFAQDKYPEQARCCYLGAVHPVLNTDGYIYPCDSLVLNDSSDRRFHEEFRLCHWSNALDYYTNPIRGNLIDIGKCPRCVFTRNNDILAAIIEKPKHVNFI